GPRARAPGGSLRSLLPGRAAGSSRDDEHCRGGAAQDGTRRDGLRVSRLVLVSRAVDEIDQRGAGTAPRSQAERRPQLALAVRFSLVRPDRRRAGAKAGGAGPASVAGGTVGPGRRLGDPGLRGRRRVAEVLFSQAGDLLSASTA